ncbi:MAG: hypothetical protein D3910_19650 [Candidatus Electrothrix sp. ATG2]|nr:hypothetical protein [Candidatus Electrothrix sp. ATG2]
MYVNVSSNQRALTNALAKLYQVELTPADPALERARKVGAAVGEWWRALPRYAQHTAQVSEAAGIVRDHIFQPLAELDPDTEQILLRDAFIHVFDADKKVPQKRIEEVVGPIKEEYETVLNNLKQQVVTEYSKVFGESSDAPEQSLSNWFCELAEEKKDYLYSSGPKILVDTCREQSGINEESLLETAEKLTGLNISSWSDDLVVQFGAKLDAAKDYVDTFSPEPPPKPSEANPPSPRLDPSQACLALTVQGKNEQRIFELIDELSPNGTVLENMLNSTLEQVGKGLDEKEKTAVLYRIIRRHIFGKQS